MPTPKGKEVWESTTGKAVVGPMPMKALVRRKSATANWASARFRAWACPFCTMRYSISKASTASLEVKAGSPSLTRLPPRLITRALKLQMSVEMTSPLLVRLVSLLAASSTSAQVLGGLRPRARKASLL